MYLFCDAREAKSPKLIYPQIQDLVILDPAPLLSVSAYRV